MRENAAGWAFYARCMELIAAIEAAESKLTASGSGPAGLIRVTAQGDNA